MMHNFKFQCCSSEHNHSVWLNKLNVKSIRVLFLTFKLLFSERFSGNLLDFNNSSNNLKKSKPCPLTHNLGKNQNLHLKPCSHTNQPWTVNMAIFVCFQLPSLGQGT